MVVLLVTSSSEANDEACPHRAEADLRSKCLPIETEKSTVGDLTLLVTGTEVELNLQRSPGKAVV